MKKLILIIAILFSISAIAQKKPSQMSSATVDAFKLKLDILTKTEADTTYNKVVDNINPHDSVWYKDETYHKDTINSKLSKKANLYQPTLVNPTANTLPVGTNTTGLATTEFVNNKLNLSDINNTLNLLTRKNYLLPLAATTMTNALSSAMVDGYEYITTYRAIKPITVDTIQFFLSTSTASYTADNYNGLCLYSISGGVDNPTFTKVTQIADTPDIWKAAANTLQTFVFPVSTVFNPGDYFAIGYVWNASDATTAPIMLCIGSISINLSQITTAANLRLQTARSGRTVLDNTPSYSSYADQLGIPYILIK